MVKDEDLRHPSTPNIPHGSSLKLSPAPPPARAFPSWGAYHAYTRGAPFIVWSGFGEGALTLKTPDDVYELFHQPCQLTHNFCDALLCRCL